MNPWWTLPIAVGFYAILAIIAVVTKKVGRKNAIL